MDRSAGGRAHRAINRERWQQIDEIAQEALERDVALHVPPPEHSLDERAG